MSGLKPQLETMADALKNKGKRTCDSGSVWTMLTDSRSLKSTNLPLTIWLTVLAGTGEKPGPTTKAVARAYQTAS